MVVPICAVRLLEECQIMKKYDKIVLQQQKSIPSHPLISAAQTTPKNQAVYRSLFWASVVSALLLIATGTLVSGKGGAMPEQTTVERRISAAFTRFGMTIKEVAERPDQPAGDVKDEIKYVVKDIFTTINGSWEANGDETAIPQWAIDAYQSQNFMEAGSSQHLFAAVIGQEGQLLKNHSIRFWSDGFDKLADPDYQNYVTELTKDSSGWANNTLWNSSAYNPDQGATGPWCWTPSGIAEVVCGGGLPYGNQISTFVVWQAVRVDSETPTPTRIDPTILPTPIEPDPTVTPLPTNPTTPTPDVTPSTPDITPIANVAQRLGSWVSSFGVGVEPWTARLDAERENHASQEVIYVLKDLFTTRDGNWEPSDIPGSIDLWAREEYLKPFGAPDYFDDAGADHHLFAAVIGLDGKLISDTEITYWSDGYAMLGDPTYTGYVTQTTKTKSGWANIIISGSSSYVPERGEHGPWCWMPKGAADVVCGGGMPAKWHVSTFAVWQAVRRSDLIIVGDDSGTEESSGDFSVFLPFVTR